MNTTRTLAAALTASVLVLGGAAGASAAPTQRGEARAAAAAVDIEIRATDAPRAIRVGAAVVPMPITVITEEPVDDMEAAVFSPRDDFVAYGYTDRAEAGRPAVFKPLVELYAEDLTSWGAHEWDFFGYREADQAVAYGVLATEVKAHSLLGVAASRSGSSVSVRGSARAYHSLLDRYVAWSGRPVSVQRWTGSSWVQVTGVTTDARGNVATTVQVPASTQLRLVTRDVSSIWGSVSATTTV